MPVIERPDLFRRRKITAGIKMILLAAVVFGLLLRTCWYQKKDQYYEITDIEITEQISGRADVVFSLSNFTRMEKTEPILVKLFTSSGDLLASRISSIEIAPRSKKNYRIGVENWNRQLSPDETLRAEVEIYKPSILK